MANRGKHARPKKRRGNDATPIIHIAACALAWITSLNTVQHLTGTNEWFGHTNPVVVVFVVVPIVFALWELAFAAIISAGCVIVEERRKSSAERLKRKALKRL